MLKYFYYLFLLSIHYSSIGFFELPPPMDTASGQIVSEMSFRRRHLK